MKQTKIVAGQAVFSMCHLLTLCGEPDAVQVLQSRLPSGSVSWPIREEVIGWCSKLKCLSFVFLYFFFSFLCFAKVGFMRGNCHCICVVGGRETCCLGSARVYVHLIFSEVSILLTQWLPVSFLLVLIFIEIVPNWESTVLGPESNSTNL